MGRLFEGGDYFKYFRQRGAIIRGNTVTCNSSLWKNENMFSKNKTKQNDQENQRKRDYFSARVEPQSFDVYWLLSGWVLCSFMCYYIKRVTVPLF